MTCKIMSRYRERMFAVGFAMLKKHADAEEIAQEALIRAHRGLARFRGNSSLSAGLHGITLNLSRNRFWYFYRRRRHVTLSLDCTFSDHHQATFSDLVAKACPDFSQPPGHLSAGECAPRLPCRCRERT